MRKASAIAAIAVFVAMALAAQPARAAANGITVAPWTFKTGTEAAWTVFGSDFQLFLAKDVPTSQVAAAGANLNGFKGLSTDGLTIGFTVVDLGGADYCSNGAPRFNLHLVGDPNTYFLGCALGDRNANVVSFTAGKGYGLGPGCEVSCQLPAGGAIDSLTLVFDEQGATHLDNIFVGTFSAGGPGHFSG